MNNKELFEGLPLLRRTLQQQVFLFDKAIEAQEKESLKNALLKERDRWIFKNDLWALALATGHNLMVERFHRPLCEWISLQNWQVARFLKFPRPEGMPLEEDVLDLTHPAWNETHRLWLLFRSAFKTTLITKLHTLQLLLNFPDLRICLTHFKQDIASQRLVAIKELFRHPVILRAFPEMVPQEKEWGTKTQVSVASRKPTTQDEASLTALGVETTTTGAHFDIFKDDDIVTDKSVTTEEQIRQSSEWMDRSISLFTNPTLRIRDTVGTRYHFADAYSRLKEHSQIFLAEVPLVLDIGKGALSDRGEVLGESILPERFPKEKIQELVSSLEGGLWEMNCQYQMSPSDPAQNQFHPDQIVTFDLLPEPLNIVISVDPASSRKRSSDYTAMKVIGIDSKGFWYWVDGLYDRLDVFQRVEAECDFVEKYAPLSQTTVLVLYEAIAFQNSDVQFFNKRRAERNLKVNTVELKVHTKRKEDRIRGLIPKYQRHEIFWPSTLKRYSQTEGKVVDLVEMQRQEFLKFPLSLHDDFLDAESFLLMTDISKPREKEVKKETHGTWKEAHDRLKKFNELKPRRSGTDAEIWQEAYGDEALVGISERYE